MIVLMCSKIDLQARLKACRQAQLTVTKLDSGYEVYAGDELVLRAMNGRFNYLVRMKSDLFS